MMLGFDIKILSFKIQDNFVKKRGDASAHISALVGEAEQQKL